MRDLKNSPLVNPFWENYWRIFSKKTREAKDQGRKEPTQKKGEQISQEERHTDIPGRREGKYQDNQQLCRKLNKQEEGRLREKYWADEFPNRSDHIKNYMERFTGLLKGGTWLVKYSKKSKQTKILYKKRNLITVDYQIQQWTMLTNS